MRAGPSPDAELGTLALARTIPLLRSKHGHPGWEILAPRGLEGHVTSSKGTHSIETLARDARWEDDLAVILLPDGARGSLELGDLVLRFEEVDEALAPPIVARPDETSGGAIRVAAVAVALALTALFGQPGAKTDEGLWIASSQETHTGARRPAGTGARVGGGATRAKAFPRKRFLRSTRRRDPHG